MKENVALDGPLQGQVLDAKHKYIDVSKPVGDVPGHFGSMLIGQYQLRDAKWIWYPVDDPVKLPSL
jgi:hypothetical protein